MDERNPRAAAKSTGHFVMHDLMTTDIDESHAFYREFFGWDLAEESGPNGDRRLFDGAECFGGMVPWPDNGPDRTYWTGYVLVDDLAVAVDRAKAKGARGPLDRMEIPDTGAFAVVIDPTGGELIAAEFESDMPVTAQSGDRAGTVAWNELITTDASAAAEFYTEVFAWTFDNTLVEQGGYAVARIDGTPAAGLLQPVSQPNQGGWVTYFDVENIEQMVFEARSLGGLVAHEVVEVPGIGKTAWMLDNLGALFGLMEIADGWVDNLP